jgi:hypothetical protein
MSVRNTPSTAARKTRNDEVLEFLRRFATWAMTQMEAIERSQPADYGVSDREWSAAHLRAIQAYCEFWERRLGDRITSWQREDEAQSTYDPLN